MILEPNEKDFLQAKLVTPGWYRVRINGVEEKPNKNGDGMNAWIKGEILNNADTGSKEFAGVPTPYLWLYSDKAVWGPIALMAALGVEVGPGKRMDVSNNSLAGREVIAFIGNVLGKNDGKMYNSITDQFKPIPKE